MVGIALMPLLLNFTRHSLALWADTPHSLIFPDSRLKSTATGIALFLIIAAFPLLEYSMHHAMAAGLLIYGPLQLLRSIPYDIRMFILTHSRVSRKPLHLHLRLLMCSDAKG
jgi:hypothetical protein